jgi:cytoskeletal protein RodZ
LPTVGDLLRAEREKQNLTVKDIEKATSIRAIYIQAIEDGKYDVLPGEVYLKGFIRNYASFLGLNPQQALEVYRESQTPQPPQPAAPSVPAAPAMPPKVEAGREEEGRSSLGRWVIVLVVLAVIAGAAWAVFNQLNQSPAPQPKPPQVQVQPAPAPAPVPAPQSTPAPAPAARPIVVVAKYSADCWTQVVADGREIFEGIPRVGETLTWNANQSMIVRLGNAAGVELTYNGQPQGRLGGDGDVISKTFTVNTTGTQR